MATHDYVIANASGAAVRADLNNALAAIVSNNSSATEPATTYAYQWWYDTTAGQLKLRNAANDGWVVVPVFDSSGRLLVGTSTSISTYQLEVVNDDSINVALLAGNNAAPSGPFLTLRRSRGSTASPTVVSSGDVAGVIEFRGYSGAASAYQPCATIEAAIDGTPDSVGDTTDMPGRLVFSTTENGASSPTERMQIQNTGLARVFSTLSNWTWRTSAAAGTSDLYVEARYGASAIDTGGTVSFRVYTNGDVQNTNNSYGATSDIKLKENIVDANSQWSDIKALQVRNYNFKEGQTHTQIGLIAQEVELVSPGLVSESPDRDEDGNDLGTVTKSVNYSVLYMKAVKALQEAMERIETLEAKVAALEAA